MPKTDLKVRKENNDQLITSLPRLEELFMPLVDGTIHEEDVEESIARYRESESTNNQA